MIAKFRGYQQALGYFVEGSYLHTPQEMNDNWIVHWIVREDGFRYAIVNPETIGQSTGLKDESGTDIYVGDIVHLQYNEICIDTGIGVDCQYEIDKRIIVRDYLSIFELHEYGESIKILGNVYENPELIERDGVRGEIKFRF